MSTQSAYIPVANIERLLAEPYTDTDGSSTMLHHKIDHFGQQEVMYVPGQMLGNAKDNPIISKHWEKLRKASPSAPGNWTYLLADLDEVLMEKMPTIPKAKVQVLLSALHYLYDEKKEEGAYYKKAIEKVAEILDFPLLNEQDLLANAHQLEAVTRARSFKAMAA